MHSHPGTFHSALQVLEGKETPDLVVPNAVKPTQGNVKLGLSSKRLKTSAFKVQSHQPSLPKSGMSDNAEKCWDLQNSNN